MSNALIGLLAGFLLALAAIMGGFTGFLLALVLGLLGLAVGAWRDGALDGLLRGRSGG